MKSCLKCIHWEACEYWTRDYCYPNKNPFPLYFEEEERIDMCGFYKSKSEYDLEIVKKFTDKLIEVSQWLPLTAIPDSFVTVKNINDLIEEMESEIR